MVAELVDVYTRRPMSEGDYLEGDYAHLGQRSHRAETPRRCRVCGGPLPKPFLDQGKQQPLANGFHLPGEIVTRYPVAYAFCPACFLVQIVDPVPFSAMFNDRYPFLTGSAQTMRDYYASLAAALRRQWQPKSMLEIGCNDGTFLEHWKDLPHVGIELSANVAQMARDKGLNVTTEQWSLQTACQLAATGATNIDLICGFHCLTHIPDLNEFFQAVDVLLAPNGVLVLEDPSLADIVRAGDFAQMYDEHAWVLSLPALQGVLARHHLEIIDYTPTLVHGGSMRTTAARVSTFSCREGVERSGVAPAMQGQRYLAHACTLQHFADGAAIRCARLKALLVSYRESGQTVAAYGASSKLTLTLNRIGATPDLVRFCTDTTPTKIGKLIPGVGVPIVARDSCDEAFTGVDVLLLGAYVHLTEVLAKERAFLERGGRFLVWSPEIKLIGKE